MKLSISLSQTAGDRLGSLVELRNSNPSLVLEAALFRFADLPVAEQQRDIWRLHQSRKATTRDGWMRVFREAVAEEFDAEDVDFTGQDNPRTPRQYLGFTIMFLLDVQNPTSPPISVHVFQSQPSTDNRAVMHDWKFTKDSPVYGAAREVANWIRDNEHLVR
jgi:hypothetical protein